MRAASIAYLFFAQPSMHRSTVSSGTMAEMPPGYCVDRLAAVAAKRPMAVSSSSVSALTCYRIICGCLKRIRCCHCLCKTICNLFCLAVIILTAFCHTSKKC